MRQAARLRLILFALIVLAAASILAATLTGSDLLGWAAAGAFLAAVCAYALWRIALRHDIW